MRLYVLLSLWTKVHINMLSLLLAQSLIRSSAFKFLLFNLCFNKLIGFTTHAVAGTYGFSLTPLRVRHTCKLSLTAGAYSCLLLSSCVRIACRFNPPQALIVAHCRHFVCALGAASRCVSRETFQFFSLNPLSFTVVVI